MPGIVLCGRRWAIGSDDILIPAIILWICHLPSTIWLITIICNLDYNPDVTCSLKMYEFLIGYLIILLMILILEFMALIVSCRGTIINTKPRKFLQHIIYSRLVLLLAEIGFIIGGIILLLKFKNRCQQEWYDIKMQSSILSIVIGNSILIMVLLLSINCVYDRAGKKFYRLQTFERLYRKHPSKFGETMHSLMHRRTLDSYHENWKQRCTFICCGIKKQKNQAAFAGIADTLSSFFHKYDIVPTDILAGLLLLSQKQKLNRINVLTQVYLGIDDYVSGVPVTSLTKYIKLDDPKQLEEYEKLIYFFHYAMASYGWPLYAYDTRCACLKLFPNIRYCICSNRLFCCFTKTKKPKICPLDDLYNIEIEDDNSCFCYFDALLKQLPSAPQAYRKHNNNKRHIEIIYANFYSDVEKTPYYVAVDYLYKKVVIAIRGTESLQDAITDMQHHQIKIPGIDSNTDWYAHQGMTNAACYIKSELESRHLLERAFEHNKERETHKFDLLVVGHSLGAGTGAILSILLKQKYPNIKCYGYSPPGGLLSEACMLETKSFITSIVVGKDMVPRLGMYQMEKLRSEVMEVLQNSRMAKWQIISGLCCIRNRSNKSQDDQINDINDMLNTSTKKETSEISDTAKVESVYLCSPLSQVTEDAPTLYPPGRILHIVRKYPRKDSKCKNNTNNNNVTKTAKQKVEEKPPQPTFQIIEADNRNFNELLISPRMLQDHMPQSVLNAMKAALNDQLKPKQDEVKKVNKSEEFSECNELRGDKICELQPLSQINNKFSKMKRTLFCQNMKVDDGKNSNRQSKAISVCSYENIVNFAPLAKPESLSDVTNYDDSFIGNSFRNSILKIHNDNEEDDEESNNLKNEHKTNENDDNNNKNTIAATSTPRNEVLIIENNIKNNLSSNSNRTETIPDFNSTSLSIFNTQLNLHSSSIECSGIDKNSNLSELNFKLEENHENLTFSMSNDSKNNNINNISFIMDDNEYTSIEKLEILKPQTRDYILCFNTSIDSSLTSNSKNSLLNPMINNNQINLIESKTGLDFDSGIELQHPVGNSN